MMKKMSLNDEQLDQVTGGTVIPYKVLAGDSFASLEKAFHAGEALIKKWNNLPDDYVLKVGDELTIYF